MKTLGAQISGLFPHSNQRGKIGGNAISPSSIGQSILLLTCLIGAPLHAAPPGGNKQVDQALLGYLQQFLNKEAAQRHWKNMRFSYEKLPMANSAPSANCSQALMVSGGNSSNLARQRLTLTCPASPTSSGWTQTLVLELQVFLPVLFSAQVIERGENISAAMVKPVETDVAKTLRGFYQDEAQLIGMGAKRRIRENQLLTQDLITQPHVVHRGDKVKVIAERDGIAASVMGEAQENGAIGEFIRVKNITSGKSLTVKVIEPGLVSSRY